MTPKEDKKGDVFFVCKCDFECDFWRGSWSPPNILPKNVYQNNIPGCTFVQDIFQII